MQSLAFHIALFTVRTHEEYQCTIFIANQIVKISYALQEFATLPFICNIKLEPLTLTLAAAPVSGK